MLIVGEMLNEIIVRAVTAVSQAKPRGDMCPESLGGIDVSFA